MRRSRLIVGLVVAVLTFFVGYLGYRLVNSYSDKIVDAIYPASPLPTNNPMDIYAVHFEPTYSCQDFRSAADAHRALQTHYKSADLRCYNSKVLRREPKVNREGQEIGTRIVAIIGCGKEGQQYATIWWTDATKFCEIEAPELYQAENLERAKTR
jgi:hypothetical protein